MKPCENCAEQNVQTDECNGRKVECRCIGIKYQIRWIEFKSIVAQKCDFTNFQEKAILPIQFQSLCTLLILYGEEKVENKQCDSWLEMRFFSVHHSRSFYTCFASIKSKFRSVHTVWIRVCMCKDVPNPWWSAWFSKFGATREFFILWESNEETSSHLLCYPYWNLFATHLAHCAPYSALLRRYMGTYWSKSFLSLKNAFEINRK